MNQRSITRRSFLSGAVAAGVSLAGASRPARAAFRAELPPVRTMTKGPKHHWFGYYDKLEFDPTSRYVLGQEVGFEHRSPKPEDVIKVGMVDLKEKDRWIELGQSTAWCWQQGCMLQWIPGSKTKVLWNDRDGSSYVSRILDVKTRALRTIPRAIYALSPDGRTGISADFRRLGDTRPGYGYNGIPDPNFDVLAPKDSGIWRIDLETGRDELLFSLADVVAFGQPLPSSRNAKHWFNHLLFNTDGSRFVFLHRWQVGTKRETRMVTAGLDGKDLRILDDNGLTSHFIWRDSEHILAFSKQRSHGARFYLFHDGSDRIEAVGPEAMTTDGHCTYLPNRDWVLNDTYPDKDRLQNPYLYHVKTGRVVPLGHFRSAPEYTGEWRCDTHPRISPDGRTVVIDSPHSGEGRQLLAIDISAIV
ncbi:MAG: hypothetical protein AB7O26_05340 [Planctomycetaceae bacterium]